MANVSTFAFTNCYWDPDLQATVCAPGYEDSFYGAYGVPVGGYYPGPYIETGIYPVPAPWYGGVGPGYGWYHGGWGNEESFGTGFHSFHGGYYHHWHHR